jgi:tetratricopeptide (TPR) repeat protein
MPGELLEAVKEADSLYDEGAALYLAGDFYGALEKIERSMSLYEKFGLTCVVEAAPGVLNKFAQCLAKVGRHTEALAHFDKLTGLYAQRDGARHSHTLTARRNAAHSLFQLGRLDKALERQECLLKHCQESLGDSDELTLFVTDDIGTTLLMMERPQEAHTFFKVVVRSA